MAARGGERSGATEDQAIEIVVEFPEIVEAGIAFAQYAGSPVNFLPPDFLACRPVLLLHR